jgi:hypothetical protein
MWRCRRGPRRQGAAAVGHAARSPATVGHETRDPATVPPRQHESAPPASTADRWRHP